eukprot:CAMPEP_0170509702 /NCGR_PEP_ID=MMETSP0208-20121228/65359_1 /TAXON_ID=197538 /ORGANISM="Strombidium inclinatum, Strain S3" /LENGTH=288 /DNA_ID=CAMNT_0010793085 /DNA_START=1033 /DNA_END=1895 /DNA_ORIENTATION=-
MVKDLRKVYKTEDNQGLLAVDRSTFAVKKGEVFGLLGPNGAGKSTTFGALTFDSPVTSGQIKMFGVHHYTLNPKVHLRNMGMCPQVNTLWDVLTVDQTLRHVGRIKGLLPADLEFEIAFIQNLLDLTEFTHTRSGELSGGNKRKLVCAVSLIGCPKIEFLDEPTTGVDPVSRRALFKMLKNLRESSVVMTTHRMDEAEALCDNIAIMINGKFAAVGSPSQLKSAYGEGYKVVVRHSLTQTQIGDKAREVAPFLEMEGEATMTSDFTSEGKLLVENGFRVAKDMEAFGG